MNLKQLLTLMQTDMNKCLAFCEKHSRVPNVYDNITCIDPLRQYNPETHDVTDKVKRPDKQLYDEDGNYIGLAVPNRIPISKQKTIVLFAAKMLGNPELEANADKAEEIKMLDAIKYLWESNKLNFSFMEIVETTMSERCCAELWYTRDEENIDSPIESKKTWGMKILSRSRGDGLYPVFDEFDNMIAFGRGYKVLNEDAKEVQHFDVYTADKVYSSKFENNVWLWGLPGPDGLIYQADFTGSPNVLGKIPVVYYYKPQVEWHDIQWAIERRELVGSNLGDTNDYSGSPILKGTGRVLGMSKKGEQGKYVELENGATLEYLTYDSAPESQKLEIGLLEENISSESQTPNLSFEKLITLGNFSQVALRTIFSSAHFKASKNETYFGIGVQRRINLLKKAISVLDPTYKSGMALNIKPKFTYYIPSNATEDIDRIAKAVETGVLSIETAVNLNPLVSDPASELQRIQDEKEAAQAKVLQIAQQTKPFVPVNN